ncbi:hypothetical protein NOF55_21945 [Rhizobiaceae bacterium BDR2-2]|uniref:Uncharacterized protein n=1 Tax=Ectorhizobium quercum TaxID=2965071 RepID=A0AAE3SWT8_9HYPH|nr:hypothetical protein [Ectorhizobium quercum]MCX8999770.1 hypothetical protein [Ectorhizobium quercum]
MTIIVTRQESVPAACLPHSALTRALAGLIDLAAATLERYLCWSQRRATERAIASMPPGMRKDFGWPAPDRR